MKINSLTAENFRNFEKTELSFDDTNIIYGENAQGKTNLIEAIYLFSGAKSFRSVKDSELIKFGQDYYKLYAEFENEVRKTNASITYQNSKKKEIKINGVKKSYSDLGEEFKTVIFSPIHLSMIKDGPKDRRKFIDSALFQIKSNYKKLISEYSRALRQRNIMLADISYNSSLYEMIDIWDESIAKTGAKIVTQRKKYIEALQPFASEIFTGISSGKESLKLSLNSNFDYSHNIEETENSIKEKLKQNLSEDVRSKTTSIGPHRDDIEIIINDLSAKKYGSQGQQRSAVLALKMAEAQLLCSMTQQEPVVLLDDVMSELDESRQDYILSNMLSRQIFITCCDKNTVLRLKKGKTILISSGQAINE